MVAESSPQQLEHDVRRNAAVPPRSQQRMWRARTPRFLLEPPGRDFANRLSAASFWAGSSPSLGDVVGDAGVLLRPWVQPPQGRSARRCVTRSRVVHRHIGRTTGQQTGDDDQCQVSQSSPPPTRIRTQLPTPGTWVPLAPMLRCAPRRMTVSPLGRRRFRWPPRVNVAPPADRRVASPRCPVGSTSPHPGPGRARPCRRSGWPGPAPA